jgi:hypothetical protein
MVQLVQALRHPIPAEIPRLFKAAVHCGTKTAEEEPSVCCPKAAAVAKPQDTATTTTTTTIASAATESVLRDEQISG